MGCGASTAGTSDGPDESKGKELVLSGEEAKIVQSQQERLSAASLKEGKLQLDEWYAEQLRQKILQYVETSGGIEKTFRVVDKDKSATVDEKEFLKLMMNHAATTDADTAGDCLSEREARSLFIHLDEDDTGTIELDEFKAWVKTGLYKKISKESLAHLAAGNTINPTGEEARIVQEQQTRLANLSKGRAKGVPKSIRLSVECVESMRIKMIRFSEHCGGADKTFKQADDNESKTVDEAEFGKIMRLAANSNPHSATGVLTEKQAIAVFWHLDEDESGQIELDEFRAWLKTGIYRGLGTDASTKLKE